MPMYYFTLFILLAMGAWFVVMFGIFWLLAHCDQ